MSSTIPHIRTFTADEWPTYRDLRLQALADSPDAFGRTHAEERARPDDWWSDRLASGAGSGLDLPLVAEVEGRPVGMSWGRIDRTDHDLAYLFQMWVAPGHRRRGAGRMLLEAVIDWARGKGVRSLVLGVTVGDSPARRLYERAGFEPTGEPQPLRQGSELLEQRMRLVLREGLDR